MKVGHAFGISVDELPVVYQNPSHPEITASPSSAALTSAQITADPGHR